jgi:YidC/Oxa1 family membrane protein insertase
MDKQATFGFVLIGLVLIVWMMLQSPPPPPPASGVPDTTTLPQPAVEPPRDVSTPSAGAADQRPDSLGRFFIPATTGPERILVVRTDLYRAEITTRGGRIRRWELSQYTTWDGHPVQLVDYDAGGDLSMLFTSSDGRLISTKRLDFQTDFRPRATRVLQGEDSCVIDLTLPVAGGGLLVKRYTFRNGRYDFRVDYRFERLGGVISNFEYQLVWENGLRYAERNSVDESSSALAFASQGGELTELDATSREQAERRDMTGSTDWVATRTKYFLLAMMPDPGTAQGAYLEGKTSSLPDEGTHERYTVALKMPYRGAQRERSGMTVYLGPIDYDRLREYGRGLENTMSLGAAWVIRPISEYIMIPLLTFLRGLIPNYGVVIIVFSIIIKIALHPLTKTSMRSMRKMQALTPMMNEIREKYKENPEKMNQAVMQLYRDYGVNPAAGCLPLLLQMPILFALWSVLRSAIELRHASFALWITDLSVPDVLFALPFSIPLFGVREVSGVALAMGLTMFIQQKMTVTDPRQKAMVWMMPILMTLIFNSLPSGLNLYYFVFNLLSIGQQVWINKQHGNETLRKVEKKKGGGWMQQMTKDMPKLKR